MAKLRRERLSDKRSLGSDELNLVYDKLSLVCDGPSFVCLELSFGSDKLNLVCDKLSLVYDGQGLVYGVETLPFSHKSPINTGENAILPEAPVANGDKPIKPRVQPEAEP